MSALPYKVDGITVVSILPFQTSLLLCARVIKKCNSALSETPTMLKMSAHTTHRKDNNSNKIASGVLYLTGNRAAG